MGAVARAIGSARRRLGRHDDCVDQAPERLGGFHAGLWMLQGDAYYWPTGPKHTLDVQAFDSPLVLPTRGDVHVLT